MHERDMTFPAGDGLLGRVVDAAGAPLDGAGELTDVRPAKLPPPAPGGAGGLWETGIKAIDLYAPLARGGTAVLVARPGVGMVVQVCELAYRLARRHGGRMVIAKLDGEIFELRELADQLRESGVERETALIGGRLGDPPAERRRLVRAALVAAEDLRARGRDVLLVLDDGLAIAETADLLEGRAGAGDAGSLTLLLCLWRHTAPEPAVAPEVAPLLQGAARLVLSSELAKRGIWPAFDALASASPLAENGRASAEHAATAAAARRLLREESGGEDAAARGRAEKLLLFQAQPFFVAEPFTARPGEHVPLAETVRAVGEIVRGAHE